jgi:hypothetical protein
MQVGAGFFCQRPAAGAWSSARVGTLSVAAPVKAGLGQTKSAPALVFPAGNGVNSARELTNGGPDLVNSGLD